MASYPGSRTDTPGLNHLIELEATYWSWVKLRRANKGNLSNLETPRVARMIGTFPPDPQALKAAYSKCGPN